MELKITSEWLDRKLKVDDSADDAGCMTMDEVLREADALLVTPSVLESETQLGKVIQFVREAKGWTQERLASLADIENSEVVEIETARNYVPKARTIYRLAQTLDFSHKMLMELVGLSEANPGVAEQKQAYYQFAAHSKHVSELTGDDYDTIRTLVQILSDKSDDE